MNEAQIFAQAIDESDLEKRNRLVDKLCGENRRLKARVRQLLAAHDQQETFFNNPVGQDFDQTAARGEPIALTGSQIGPYKLLQQIGEGGMGLVFMAEQTEPVKRRVALKVIKPGMDSRQVIARFEAERQALAMMDHPNIAKVLDAGTTERGYPYFVMELVNGMPITEYCDQEKMPTDQRLHLFVSVCLAVQHAHQKGIIHRDLKPSNILVAEYDGLPVPKVIDFGVAKATGASLTDKTLFTQFGQVIGTMEYMSPEQARRNQLDVDTRSDIYSLGIVLYKLLTGETPFGEQRFREAALDEMLNIIREEEPPRPSVKIGSSQSLDQIAERRSIEPARLSSAVRGDLDWIVLKTLEKDRNRRYQTTMELADDVQRHLKQMPVNVRPRTLHDRIGKFTRRNRAAVIKTTVACAVGLAAILSFINWQGSQKAAKTSRTNRLESAIVEGELALWRAESSPLGDRSHWEGLFSHIHRISSIYNEGPVDETVGLRAASLNSTIIHEQKKRKLAEQIEEIVIQCATHPELESWQRMDQQMRDFFRENGYDLDQDDPADIGLRVYELGKSKPELSAMWADLLELWIATVSQIGKLSGEKTTAEIMEPWANAIYVADRNPVRTGIRRFVYTQDRNAETLDRLVKDIDLTTLRPRTISWLGTCYFMARAPKKADEVYRIALETHPHDLMLAFDYGLVLHLQQRHHEAARMFHRCLAVRDDVSGIWKSLGNALKELGEDEEARYALDKAVELAR